MAPAALMCETTAGALKLDASCGMKDDDLSPPEGYQPKLFPPLAHTYIFSMLFKKKKSLMHVHHLYLNKSRPNYNPNNIFFPHNLTMSVTISCVTILTEIVHGERRQ